MSRKVHLVPVTDYSLCHLCSAHQLRPQMRGKPANLCCPVCLNDGRTFDSAGNFPAWTWLGLQLNFLSRLLQNCFNGLWSGRLSSHHASQCKAPNCKNMGALRCPLCLTGNRGFEVCFSLFSNFNAHRYSAFQVCSQQCFIAVWTDHWPAVHSLSRKLRMESTPILQPPPPKLLACSDICQSPECR